MESAGGKEGHRAHRSRIGATLLVLLRTRITTGVLTLVPILLTLWVVKIIFLWMRDASQWAVQLFLMGAVDPTADEPTKLLERLHFDWERWQRANEAGLADPKVHFFDFLPWYWQGAIGGISVLLTLFFLYAVGLFAANLFGRRIIERLEKLVEQVPMIKTIYKLPKQVIQTFSATQPQNFRKAALIPFPQERMRSVGFITNIFTDSVTGEELCSVFIATTPNPTTGYMQILRRSEITELNWTIEEAIRCVMSGGILRPDFLTIVPNRDLPDDVPDGVGASQPLPPPAGESAKPPAPGDLFGDDTDQKSPG
jgi:uncharacterized membrane protein